MEPVKSQTTNTKTLVSEITDPNRIVGTHEAADLLGVSRRTVQRLALTGEIPVIATVGKRGEYLFKASDIEAHKTS
jgi:excisionase family DNA binding protein